MDLEPNLLLLIIFYNLCFLIIKLLTVLSINLCTYISFHGIMVGGTVSIELLISNDTRCLVLSFVFVCVLFGFLLVLTL
jgi:hypothetical protein